jgi:hypothetical protein
MLSIDASFPEIVDRTHEKDFCVFIQAARLKVLVKGDFIRFGTLVGAEDFDRDQSG